MTEAELQARIDADVQRVAAIARDSIGRWYRGTEQDIPVWDHYDEDGHERLGEREDVLLCCESRKHHVKRGILANASDRASIR
jgi:hypothetical protein